MTWVPFIAKNLTGDGASWAISRLASTPVRTTDSDSISPSSLGRLSQYTLSWRSFMRSRILRCARRKTRHCRTLHPPFAIKTFYVSLTSRNDCGYIL